MSFQRTSPSPETPDPPRKHLFQRWMGGCLIALGIFCLLFALLILPLGWGFEDGAWHGRARYSFGLNASRGEIILCPLKEHDTNTSIMFFTGALVVTVGISLWKVRFQLRFLILAVLAVGFAGAFPLLWFCPNPRVTHASLYAHFDGPLKPELAKAVEERLALKRLGEYRWKSELSFAPPTPLELTQLHYDLRVEDWCVDVHVTFVGIPFPRRPEIFECLMIFFEEHLSVIAQETGCAPLRAGDRHVEWRIIER